jgi:1-aminocyclopropane-1-carboxylate deaminase/D-cysteine desulfhydrase-like pyridoxal-dependent ACC family enzyme
MRITNEKELTRIQEIGGILFKREDLFMPFDNCNINGGKVRQCLELLETNQTLIELSCNSTVATQTSVRSPQGLIVAKSAEYFGFKSITAIASPNPAASVKKHKLLQLTVAISDVRNLAKTGQNKNILDSRLKELKKTEDFFIVNFGINADEVMRPVINQCENLPAELDYLIVPSGSCVTLAAIAEGVRHYKKKVKHLIGVQIAGYDRNKDIQKLTTANYELVVDKTYPYEKAIKNFKFEDIELDAIYEAKAFEWLQNNIDYKTNKTLFWVVANFNEFRF